MKDGPRGPSDSNNQNNNGKRERGGGRRNRPMREEFPDDEEFDVIPAAELAQTKNAMNLSEAKLDLPGSDVKVRELQPGKVYSLMASFPAGFELQSGQQVALTVKTDHPGFPLLRKDGHRGGTAVTWLTVGAIVMLVCLGYVAFS